MRESTSSSARPEQVFFDDPAVDRLMGIFMNLAMEHYVLRDRLHALEQQLARSGHLDLAALSAAPAPEHAAADHADAQAFAAALLRPLLGMQEAAGAAGRFTLKKPRAGDN